VEEIVPTAGLSVQLTAVFVEPLTVAVNCLVEPGFTVATVGLSEIETVCVAETVTEPEAFFVASATDVAVTVMVCAEVELEGAVYRPDALIAPIAGLMDQVTAVFVAPEIVALNWVDCPGAIVPPPEMEMATGVRLTVALLDFVGSEVSVAVT
jgi:hypothetical protein